MIVNFICSHNYCLLHIAKTGHLRCCLYIFRLLFGCSSTLSCGNRHLSPALKTRFILKEFDTRANANIHKAFACKYPSNNIYMVVEEWIDGYLCLGYSSSTHFDLVIRLAQKMWRQCVLVFAHDLGFRGGNCNGHLANTGLFLSTGNRYLFLLQRLTIPVDTLSLLLLPFSHDWRQSFVIAVSDLFSS